MADVIVKGDTSGAVTLSAPAVAGTVTVTLPATSGTMLTTASSTGISGSAISSGTVPEAYGGTGTSTGYYGFKNRIINGAMVIDQRNAGASVTPTNGQYLVDRFYYGASQASKFTAQQTPSATETGFATRVAAGFTNYLAFTVASAVSVGVSDLFFFSQPIEGLNVTDLAWGTANAKTVTLSFLAYSSLTGTFGGALTNSAANRSYPFSYTISTANTWTSISVTIAGDTSGTWLTTNGVGIYLRFGLGAGSNFTAASGAWGAGNIIQPNSTVSVVGTASATFYITGVQLEKGSTATSFDYRPYGTELALCQRYLPKFSDNYGGQGQCVSTTQGYIIFKFPVTTRTLATGITTSGGTGQTITNSTMGNVALSAIAFSSGGVDSGMIFCTVASGLVAGNATTYNTNGGIIFFTGCEL
jgi:hypothetical protein